MSKGGLLVVLVGIPASGKSTLAKQLLNEKSVAISRDKIRFSMIKDGEDYFSKEKEVYNLFVKEINENLALGKTVIADATHVSKSSRRKLLNRINKDVTKIALVVSTNVETCKERNSKRAGLEKVPNSAIDRMVSNFEYPEEEEGFKYILYVEVDN